VDCGSTSDWYTVHDATWRAAGLRKRDFCCLACLEKRLKRPLALDDFPPCTGNTQAYAAAGKLHVVVEEDAHWDGGE
jgi:hypothetical protein